MGRNMNKHNILGFLAVLISVAVFSGPARSETIAEKSVKHIKEHVSQKCTSELHPALCTCEMDRVKGPQFTLFAKTLKTEEDFPKLQDYYTHNIVVPCVLDRKISQKICIQNMKSKTSEYTDQVINDFCECMAEEVAENVTKHSLASKDRFQIIATISAENDKAFKVCDRVRIK